ncbi:beta-lactamase/transpeptidase-like protein [Biscogniauxia marginata]|nr:beta-lactamase/transpeptidase-like protein [Biscogniauxia marginata]
MTHEIDQVYAQAVASGLLPGASLSAGDKDGKSFYTKSFGKASLKDGANLPFTESTICAIASMTKLMTSVAVLQCVEDGTLDLDADMKPLLPEIGKHGIITGFDDEKNTALLEPDSTLITPRMLLSHTTGHEYDWLNPLLGKWRASRNEQPWTGPTVEHKSVLPLVFKPGTGFAYGAGHDWAGKLVEVVTKSNLESFMLARIWTPLGIEDDASFYPKTKESMKGRIADISSLNEKGEPPAVDVSATFDILFGGTDCLGGGGLFMSTKAYHTFLTAVLRRDSKLLQPSSYEELFRPQLNEKCEQALNDYIALSPTHTKTWSFAGLVAKEGQEERFKAGTTFWGGVPSTEWFIDHEAGICGTALCQILPPMHPSVMELHEKFQRRVYSEIPRN